MRAAWVLLLLAGCPLGPGTGTGECAVDSDCGSNVCGRDGFCYPAADVRTVRVTWTVNGMPANAATCTSPDLQIAFLGFDAGETPLGFAPVPCALGQFVIDKLPRSYSQVELGREGSGFPDARSIGTTNIVAFDLRF
jgi:hypothetical protein